MRAAAAKRSPGCRAAILVAIAAVFMGAIAAYILVNGSMKMVLFIPGIALVLAGFFRPEVIFWPLLALNVCFSGQEFATGTQSVWRPGAYILDPFRFNISQILILVLLVILLARWLLGVRMVRVPKPVWIPAVLFLCVYGFQLVRALTAGATYNEVVEPFNGGFVLFGVAAFWCFIQVADTPAKRLRLIDGLFALAAVRSLIALFNYVFGSGDVSNAYRDTGVKVALWEAADHMLFTMLIVIAIAGWATRRIERTRVALWMAGSVIMAVTVMLSFRRASWFGLAAAIALTVVLLAPRSKRAAALGPVVVGMVVGILAFAQQRFVGSGSLLARIFSDLEANKGPTRQQEWGLAWQTITKNPLAGDITARRAGSTFANWDTRIVHNALLYAWMKFGLLGMLSLALLPVACGCYAWRAVRNRVNEAHLAFGAVGLAPIILFYCLAADPLIEIRTMLNLALAGALGLLVWIQRDAARDTAAPDAAAQDAAVSDLGE